MPSVFADKEAVKILRWLKHGSELAQDLKGTRATHIDAIWLLFQESLIIMDQTPDQEKRWLTSGYRSGGWSGVGLTRRDLEELEKVRYLASMKPYDGQATRPMAAHEHDRSYDVLCFPRWCGVYVKSRKPDAMKKAAVHLARSGDCEAFRRVWVGKEKDITRSAVSKFKQVFVGHVMAGLREELSIFPLENTCKFVIGNSNAKA